MKVKEFNKIEKGDSLAVINAKLNAIGSDLDHPVSAFELSAFIDKVKELIRPAKLKMWICAGIGKESKIFTSVQDVLDNDAHPIYDFRMEASRDE